MRFILPILIFLPGYWLCVSGRGFGGLWALFLSPIALLIALAVGPILRHWMNIDSKLHLVDFVGVVIVLPIVFFLIPTIR
jgi:hypothetical protein